MKRLKTMRHPNMLTFVDGLEVCTGLNDDGTYVRWTGGMIVKPA